MPEPVITAELFRKRLARLCLSGEMTALPRSQQDRHILFKSMQLAFRHDVNYSERDVNDLLDQWRDKVGSNLECDCVSLRRSLVDHGYLLRTTDGSRYTVGQGSCLFEPDVDLLDPRQVIETAHRDREQRKIKHTNNPDSGSDRP